MHTTKIKENTSVEAETINSKSHAKVAHNF